MSTDDDFYVFLLSNTNMDLHPSNTLTEFTTTFDKPLVLDDSYVVGVAEMSIPSSFLNIPNSPIDNNITVNTHRSEEVISTFEEIPSTEGALQRLLSEHGIEMKYVDFRYVFELPAHIRSIKFPDKLLQDAIGIHVVNRDSLEGTRVPRANSVIPIPEDRAAVIRFRHPVAVLPDFIIKPGSSLLRSFAEFFARIGDTESQIDYRDNKYTLQVPLEYQISTEFLRAIKASDVTIRGVYKIFHGEPITKTYRAIINIEEHVETNISLQPGYYETPETITTAINEHLRGKAAIVYDGWTKRCTLNIEKGVTLRMSEYFSYLLGFGDTTTFREDTYTGASEASTDLPIHAMMLYSNIVKHSIVGDSLHPILKVVPFEYAKDRNKMNFSFENIQYFRLGTREVSSITIYLFDDTGRKLPLLDRGRTLITLHFKRNVR